MKSIRCLRQGEFGAAAENRKLLRPTWFTGFPRQSGAGTDLPHIGGR